MHNEPFRSAPCWQTDEWQDQEDFLMTMSARKIDDLLASICLHCGNKSMRPSGARGLLDRAMELPAVSGLSRAARTAADHDHAGRIHSG